jgi:hypothetical protein
MGGNVTREDFENNPVLRELLRTLEEPCKEQICVCGECVNKEVNEIMEQNVDSRNKTFSTEQNSSKLLYNNNKQ